MPARVHDSADVDERAILGDGTTVWHLAQVREDAEVGAGCIVGRGAYVGTGVRIGDNCKIQNHALVYEPADLADGVFIGPAVVLTNDVQPRAIAPDGQRKSADDWEAAGVRIGTGASIGASSVVVAGVAIGAWAMVGAGATVTRDVPAFALVLGAPARRVGWVGRSGQRLEAVDADPGAAGPGAPTRYQDPVTGDRFVEIDGELTEEAT